MTSQLIKGSEGLFGEERGVLEMIDLVKEDGFAALVMTDDFSIGKGSKGIWRGERCLGDDR